METAIPKPQLQPYAHRAFMGLAGSFMADTDWSACLQRCMPALHAQCIEPGIPITKLMRLLEGNPVLAAYGLWRSDDKSLPMEWDLWLDPHAPGDWRRARVIHGNDVATDVSGSPQGVHQGEAVMSGTYPGSDVFGGLTPMQWAATFREAAQTRGLTVACRDVYLDVKSPWSTAADIAAFTRSLAQEGIEVRGVLTFKFAQLAPPLQVPHRVHLTHGPCGLATALARGDVPQGAMVMFNGGALVDDTGPTPAIDTAQLALTQRLRQTNGLHVGLYLQEDAISPRALTTLIDCINREKTTFAGGLAYGGLLGVAEGLIERGSGQGCQTENIRAENNAWYAQQGPAKLPRA